MKRVLNSRRLSLQPVGLRSRCVWCAVGGESTKNQSDVNVFVSSGDAEFRTAISSGNMVAAKSLYSQSVKTGDMFLDISQRFFSREV